MSISDVDITCNPDDYGIVDTQLHDDYEVETVDYTLVIPPIEGTSDTHPMDCRCIPCKDEQEYIDYVSSRCECELDWRCGACGPGYSPLELMNDEYARREGCPEWAQ